MIAGETEPETRVGRSFNLQGRNLKLFAETLPVCIMDSGTEPSGGGSLDKEWKTLQGISNHRFSIG